MSTIQELDANPELAAGTGCNHKSRRSKSKQRKYKENHFKPRYSKELKNKLKKYKLRRDGEEDPEVLDVSKILVSTLKIKSPNSINENKNLDEGLHEIRPKNYLFKMGRRKVFNKTAVKSMISKESEGLSLTTQVEVIADCKVLNEKCEIIKTAVVNNTENESVINGKDKRHTNAFKLMMESRNKSIGSNSPGKERVLDDCEIQCETNERKKLKVKRTLILEKMAEMKGALKKKEIEDYQDKVIKNKMDKRAERLKKMIVNHEKPRNKDSVNSMHKTERGTPKCPDKTSSNILLPNQKIKIIDLFQESNKNVTNTMSGKKYISEEDKEFLKKLSPSLKKKENMLSYFKKIDTESAVSGIGNGDIDENIDNVVLKVKLTPKAKKKIKKKKLSLNKDLKNDIELNANSEINNIKIDNELICSEDKKKPIQNTNNNNSEKNLKSDNIIDSVESLKECSTRPRRNVKRPAKYIDVLQLPSSDDELHIFTPKKKKQLESDLENKSEEYDNSNKEIRLKTKEIKSEMKINKKLLKKDNNIQKQCPKLAPIFKTKPTLDAAAIEAKQRFLNSGVPDTLKKLKEKQTNTKVGLNYFHTVVHVQQTDSATVTRNNVIFNLKDINVDECTVMGDKYSFKKLISIENLSVSLKQLDILTTNNKTHQWLKNIKQINPKFPVYRTFRLLKDKRKGEFNNCNMVDLDNSVEIINNIIEVNNENPDILNWADKYKPMTSKQIIGNFDTVKELKKWLISWTENDVKNNKYNAESDSSDFYCSDTDSKESIKISNNLLILTGPAGSGKTSMVYAVASELDFKVLEVNASSKRTGKIMLQDLQEATQSHKVNRGKNSSQDCSQKSQYITDAAAVKKSKSRSRPKKELPFKNVKHVNTSEELCPSQSSQESTRTSMSLILIDDADIVFDQDDGFCSAIVQLVQCSKRPVILIASSSTCPHLQRFFNSGKLMQTRPFLPGMLGIWLDIMCLAETNICSPGLGARLLDYYNGDMRKTINSLQFYLTKEPSKEEENASQICDSYQMTVDDENSNICWSDSEYMNDRNDTNTNVSKLDVVWQHLMRDQTDMLHYTYPMKLFNIWWNLPELISASHRFENKVETSLEKNEKANIKSTDLETLANVYEMVSVSDSLRLRNMDSNAYFIDDPWLCVESDSVSEQENLDNYNKCNEIMDDISHRLITGTIADVQTKLRLENKTKLNFPDIVLRRERNRIVARHNNLTKYLNPSAVLDRRALALDYWSTSRTICRTEKTKTDCNSKRNNRFCHYLKSINVLCNNESFDHLCNSLSISKVK